MFVFSSKSLHSTIITIETLALTIADSNVQVSITFYYRLKSHLTIFADLLYVSHDLAHQSQTISASEQLLKLLSHRTTTMKWWPSARSTSNHRLLALVCHHLKHTRTKKMKWIVTTRNRDVFRGRKRHPGDRGMHIRSKRYSWHNSRF